MSYEHEQKRLLDLWKQLDSDLDQAIDSDLDKEENDDIPVGNNMANMKRCKE